ncbi:hypothetical protein OG765_22250 [Streptomyces sp. NBC_00555]|uniref:hypothetical protein n=1 Tax=Streptomyces sp. NBC_00555 TaxID=2903662 RepID=UPI00225433E7|nr:hypothetical protein [Streptomyces sp. NBC_00555]MCX5013692.1 hypothetical protein [Streptomyces sp. NBC_00555]
MLTYENVMHAPLDKLQTAVTDWKAMVDKLDELAEVARNGMKVKADKAEWNGVTASVGREFVAKTAKEFEDAAKEAKGVHQILSDAHTTIKTARDALKKAVDEEAPAAGFRVDAAGKVSAVPMDPKTEYAARHDPDYPEFKRKQEENRKAWQTRVDQLVDVCADADESLARALSANVTDGHDFSGPKYVSLDAEQAGRAADLAKKGRDLKHDELVELNELLADNAKVPEFSKNFYETLGPKGALEFFGYMSTDTYDYSKLDEQRLKDVQELQKNLGLNLATATSSKSEPHLPDSFAQELRKLGTQHIPLAKYDQNPPYGYQLLGGIMRYGNYDPKFLVPIAEHATQIHAKDPDFFNSTRHLNGYGKNLFNPSGVNGAGYDPVVSFLEAMGHSPDAAKEFFDPDRKPHAYNQDGTEKSGPADLGKGADKKPITSYLDFFGNEKYDFTIDMEGTNPDDLKKVQQYMPDALGHALEAATLGHAWDDPSPRLVRDDTSANIMKEVVTKYGGDSGLLKAHASLADSVGNMTAGYIDDVNHALTQNDRDTPFEPKSSTGHVTLEQDEARKLLSALGQHPDAYATVSTAERVYSASVLESQVGPDGHIDKGAARETVRVGAEVQGMLDKSRADQVQEHHVAKDEEYNKALEKRSAWIEFGAGAAIAGGVAFLPATAAVGAAAILVPLAVDVGSGALEQMAGQVVGDWSEAEQKKHEDDSKKELREQKTEIYRAGEETMQAPSRRFINQYHLRDTDSEFAEDLRQAALIGYGTGADREDQQGHDPE